MTRVERTFAWAGGALFALSLAACAYWYVAIWADRSAPGGGWAAVAMDVALFGIFACHHSLLARERSKRWVARMLPEGLVRSFYVWTASVLFLAVLVCWQPVAGDLYDLQGWSAVLPALVQVLGLWFVVRAVATIDPLELAGIAPESVRGPLQVTGPYRWVRHPVYFGWVLIVFGTAHMTGTRGAFAVISTMYILVAIPWEERALLRVFGAEYAQYRHDVRWRILPYVY